MKTSDDFADWKLLWHLKDTTEKFLIALHYDNWRYNQADITGLTLLLYIDNYTRRRSEIQLIKLKKKLVLVCEKI